MITQSFFFSFNSLIYLLLFSKSYLKIDINESVRERIEYFNVPFQVHSNAPVVRIIETII